MHDKKHAATDPEVLTVFKKMIAAVEGVELKGARCPYTSLNGHMMSSISKADCIGLRLEKDDRLEFIDKYETTLFEAFPGFFQKEYVAIPESMHSNTRALRKYFKKSHEYVSSLKPKKTTKK